jgi:hypothetical protein
VFITVRRTSLLLIRVTGDTWRNLRHKLNRLHLGHPRHPDGQVVQCCALIHAHDHLWRLVVWVFDFTAYQLTRGPYRRAYHVLIKTYTHVFAGQHAKPTDQSEQVSGRD